MATGAVSVEQPKVLALFGPTASGKSALAHHIARVLDAEIVVTDPFQRYRGLEIAADAPSADERAEVPYHFIGDLDLWESSSAGSFASAAHLVIDDIIARGRLAIVTGGTALYLRGALTDLGFPPPVPPEIRQWAEDLVTVDLGTAVQELTARDPDAAHRVDQANPRRVARALEVAALGPAHRDRPIDRLWTESTRHPTALIAITRAREYLDQRIATRVQRELDDGLVAELTRALDAPTTSREALQIIGGKEVAAFHAGTMIYDELVRALEARTRQLSRRQLGWIRNWPHAHIIDLADEPATDIADDILRLIGRAPDPA